MPEIHYCDVDFAKQYHLPGVEPLRAPATTFLAQRYDPLRVPPTLHVGNGTTEQTFHDVQEMILAEMPPALTSSLAFPPPRAILATKFTRQDSDASANRGQETWAQKLLDLYENVGKCVRLAWRSITAWLLASGAALHNAVRRVCDAVMQVVEPLVGAIRGMAPERAYIGRVVVALH